MSSEVVSARTLRRVEGKILRVLAVIEERQRVIEKDLEQIRRYVGALAKAPSSAGVTASGMALAANEFHQSDAFRIALENERKYR